MQAFENYIELLSGLEMEHNFITYVIKTSLILGLILFSILGFYTNFIDALGILAGTSWAIVNLYFLKRFLQVLLKIETQNALTLYTLIGIKFPLLYLAGYGMLKMNLFPILNIVLGFSLIFIAIFLIGLGAIFSPKTIGSRPS